MSLVLDHLRLMARNNAYANERLYEACCALSAAEFDAARAGFFPSISKTLNHILQVDRYYLDALTESGRGRSVFDAPALETAAELAGAQTAHDGRLTAFCDGLADRDLKRTVPQDRGGDGLWHERVDHTLLHLFQHQIHHRGQVHAMLDSTSVAPPQLDEFFIRFDRHPVAEKHLANRLWEDTE
ncbi:damage-inducible protein DinB [Roseibium aquae]|uniref:Damage-inducible protein DinB n=1 Tax=Roseibium aquae TaxID=1323746 RepID=A0A916X1Z1_9HYPH|nr:DinB family protein [Roseibium aquae]GGB49879.1 damage-inducible protein DinB [Roseibium aquae]